MGEEEKIEKGIWKRKITWILIVTAITVAILMAILGAVITENIRGRVVIEVFTMAILLLWLKKCFRQVGTIEMPCSGVRARFGRSVESLTPGLYSCLYPIEDIKEYPTGLHRLSYKAENIHSKPETIEVDGKKIALGSQRMDVDFTFTFRWPKVGKKYRVPIIDPVTGKAKRDSQTGKVVWKKVDGGDLLKNKAFYHLPIRNPKTAPIEKFDEAFGKTIMGGSRTILAGHNHSFCRENKEEIEDEIKEYLLSEVGDPIFDCGLPRETVDTKILKIKFQDTTETAFEAPEIAWRQADATKKRAEGEAEAIKKRREAFKDVPEPMRAMLSAGIGPGGEKGAIGLDLNNLVTYLALPVLLEKLGLGEKKEGISRQELIEALKKLSSEELEELLKK
ncbi:hypothetical protein KAU51_03270 [Candidatus Parcubacteria bacterium]|nr:hypothetical protein [Candidatus Parcubacteria bacterium]